jgi:hypothetical protein
LERIRNNIITVSESLREHLVYELGLNSQHITTIPNGFETQRWMSAASTQPDSDMFGVPPEIPIILFIGRFSGPKGDIVRFLVSKVYPELSKKVHCSLQIIGGLNVPADIPQRVQDIQNRIGKTSVVLREFQRDLLPFLSAANIVIGAGRVVMESILAGKPTIAFGESGYEGLVSPGNYDTVCRTNFGDTGIRHGIEYRIGYKRFGCDSRQTTDGSRYSTLQKRIQELCEINIVEQKIDAVYRSALAAAKSPAAIPVLLYHRVVPEAPKIHIMAFGLRSNHLNKIFIH